MVVFSVVAAAALLSPVPAHAVLTTPETVNLNTYEVSSDGAAGPISTAETLADGQFYVAQVTGTFSVYEPQHWKGETPHVAVCGNPLRLPIFPTPGRRDSMVGQDALFVFARPWRGGCPGSFPYSYGGFQIDTGSGFAPRPATNAGAGPNAEHRYDFLLRGAGAAASFLQRDTQTADNNGVLQIVVRPATQADCAGNAECLGITPPASAVGESQSLQAEPSAGLPPRRTCLSRRRFRIRVRWFPRNPVVAATVVVDGRRVRVRRRVLAGLPRVVAIVDLRGKPRKVVYVRITARLRSGRIMTGRRRYQTCFPRNRGKIPRL